MPSTPSATVEETLPYECIMTFDQPILIGVGSPPTDSSSSGSGIKSDSALRLRGPREVDGSIGSMASVTLSGDFIVYGQIEAYGNLEVEGTLHYGGKIKSMGNVRVKGKVACMKNVEIFGKLEVTGTLEVDGDLTVWGKLIINGYLYAQLVDLQYRKNG